MTWLVITAVMVAFAAGVVWTRAGQPRGRVVCGECRGACER